MVPEGSAFFVYTVNEGESIQSYYSISTVYNGTEEKQFRPEMIAGPIIEIKSFPEPILWQDTINRVW